MQNLSDLIKNRKDKEDQGYIKHEFQDFGYRLALALDDLKRKSWYIRLAKSENRTLLKKALAFTLDYPYAKNRGKIFMWKVHELKGGEKI